MTGSGHGRGAPVEAPEDGRRLADQRAEARAAKDFAAADALRDQIAEHGWEVADAPGGTFTLEPVERAQPATAVAPAEVASALGLEPRFDVAVHWVCEGWLDDIDRAIAAFAANAGSRRLQFVIADVTGEAASRWGARDDVEIVWL